MATMMTSSAKGEILIPIDGLELEGEINVPAKAPGVVLFAHGSGSSRHSRRNQFVARTLQWRGLGTCLFDLLTQEEETQEQHTGHLRFDIQMLADRLLAAAKFVHQQMPDKKIGFFGASTGGGAALVASTQSDFPIAAVVSRGGRPDLAAEALQVVSSPTLLLVGSADEVVVQLNEQAFAQLQCEKEMKLIPGATHLFEEPGALDQVAELAAQWFMDHMRERRDF
jgi:alpha-beta hydrolase superfamily lysophospholipase